MTKMVTVITQLIIDKHEYQQAASHADGKAGNVDQGITFLPE
jgi:hypothetical protein